MRYRRYRSDEHIKSDGETETFYGREVPMGYVLEVTHFSGGLSSEESRLTSLGYEDNTNVQRVLVFRKLSDPQYTIKAAGKLWLEEGERPFIKIADMGDGGTAFLSVHGKLWPKEEVGSIAEVQREPDVSDNSKP